ALEGVVVLIAYTAVLGGAVDHGAEAADAGVVGHEPDAGTAVGGDHVGQRRQVIVGAGSGGVGGPDRDGRQSSAYCCRLLRGSGTAGEHGEHAEGSDSL